MWPVDELLAVMQGHEDLIENYSMEDVGNSSSV
jgi:hypothetical protein